MLCLLFTSGSGYPLATMPATGMARIGIMVSAQQYAVIKRSDTT